MEDNNEPRKAGVLIRGMAVLIDLLSAVILSQLIGGIPFIFINIENYFIIYLLTTMIISLSVLFLSELVFNTTIGKLVLGLIILPTNSDRISKTQYLIHSLLKAIWIVDFFVIAFSKNKCGIGNRASKTRIVWNKEKPIIKLGKIVICVLSVVILFISALQITGIAYKNSSIYLKSQEVLGLIKNNNNDGNIGGLKKYDYSPIQVQIVNNNGLVALKYLDDSDQKKYLVMYFAKNNGQWQYSKGSPLDKKPGKSYSISFSL